MLKMINAAVLVTGTLISPIILASCLTEVAEFAEQICGKIEKGGKSRTTEVFADLEADVSGFARKIVGGGGGSASVKSVSNSFENVLQDQLGAELFNIRDCKKQMVNVGIDQACGSGEPICSEEPVYDEVPKKPKRYKVHETHKSNCPQPGMCDPYKLCDHAEGYAIKKLKGECDDDYSLDRTSAECISSNTSFARAESEGTCVEIDPGTRRVLVDTIQVCK